MSLDLSPENTSVRPLGPVDHAASVAVENAAFTNPNHRASPDKIAYRLAVCPELTLGLFAGNVLVAHIIGTRCHGRVADDISMDYPKDWQAAATPAASWTPTSGHQPDGETVGLHSLAVSPAAQHQGVGQRLVRAYVERMRQQDFGPQKPPQRIALICRDYLVDYYKKLGFALEGPSVAQFGGGGWFDMIYEL